MKLFRRKKHRTEPVVELAPVVTVEPDTMVDEQYLSVPSDTSFSFQQRSGIEVVSFSSRGKAHRMNGMPRQDEVGVAVKNGQVVFAVADGVSSAEQAQLGAATAVVTTLYTYEPHQPTFAAWHAKDAVVRLTRSRFGGAELEGDDLLQRGCDVLATTLMYGHAESDDDGNISGQVMLIGDGAVWKGSSPTTLVAGGKNEIGEPVIGLPLIPKAMTSTPFNLDDGDALIVTTDGFGDLLPDDSLLWELAHVRSVVECVELATQVPHDDVGFVVIRGHHG